MIDFVALKVPIPISEQVWPVGTKPYVATDTLTYNHEPYIRKCLDGILMQKTTFPVRICIFEDASTDKTTELVKEYAEKYPGLIFVFCQKENTWGKGEIRKKALEPYFEARNSAKYIALCEGDDYWTDPLKLQKQVDFLEANPEYSMCFHNAMLFYEDRMGLNMPFGKIENREYSGEEILQDWIIPTASVVFRKDSYKPVNHPDFFFGDIILFLCLAEEGRIRGMDNLMSVYRKHSGSISSSKSNSIERVQKFIRHHIAIRGKFDGKYENVERIILSKNYLSLSKLQLKKIKFSFVKSIYNSYKTSPDLFMKHFISAYIKSILKR